MKIDMTTGKIIPSFVIFTIPIILGNILQTLYSVVDSVVVGKFVSVSALASIGATGTITFLFIGFIMGLTGGFAIIIGQEYGAKNTDKMKKAIAMGTIISLLFSLIILTLVILFLRQILSLLNTPADIIDGSYDYLLIIFLGLPASLAYNYQSSILRCIGDSKTPLVLLFVSCIINIVGDLVFVLCFHMGIKGVAFTTILSNFLVAIACYIYTLKKYPELTPTKEDYKIDSHMIKTLLNLGIPSALQYSISAIGCTFLQFQINKMGSTAVAGLAIGNRVEGILSLLSSAATITMSTFVAQNYGAKNYSRIKDGIKVMKVYIYLWAFASLLLVFFAHDFLAQIFISSTETETILRASEYMFCIVIFYLPAGMGSIYRSTLQGMGNGYVPMLGSIQELIVRGIGAIILPGLFGFKGACISGSFSWFTTYLFMLIAYHHIVKPYLKQKPGKISHPFVKRGEH